MRLPRTDRGASTEFGVRSRVGRRQQQPGVGEQSQATCSELDPTPNRAFFEGLFLDWLFFYHCCWPHQTKTLVYEKLSIIETIIIRHASRPNEYQAADDGGINYAGVLRTWMFYGLRYKGRHQQTWPLSSSKRAEIFLSKCITCHC